MWLHQSAEKHGIPFSHFAAGVMVDMAIASAERKAIQKPGSVVVKSKEKYTAVWVYWKGGAYADELEYSIRSAINNLSDLRNVVVCGDHPGDWYDGDFIHSKRFNKQDGRDKFGSGRFCKWIDSAVKLQRIIESELVSESFLWMYDDTFILQPWSIEQMAILRAGGNLWNYETINKPVRKTWREVMRRTAKSLVERGLQQRNYSTHYPVVYQKRLLQQTIDDFDLLNKARLVESLYLNHHFKDPASVDDVFQYSQRPQAGWAPKAGIPVVNVGGFNAAVQAFIKPMFAKSVAIPKKVQNND